MIRRIVILTLIAAAAGFAQGFNFGVPGSPPGLSPFLSMGNFKNALHDISAIDRSFRSAFSGQFRIARLESELVLDGMEGLAVPFHFSEMKAFPAVALVVTTPEYTSGSPLRGLGTETLREGALPSMINMYYTQSLLPNLKVTYGAGVGYFPAQANPNVVDRPRAGTLMDAVVMSPRTIGGLGSLGFDFALSKHISFVFTGAGRLNGLSPVQGEYLNIGTPEGRTYALSGMDLSLSYYDSLLSGHRGATGFSGISADDTGLLKARRSVFSISDYTVAGGVRFTF